jgi:hypothetical protein
MSKTIDQKLQTSETKQDKFATIVIKYIAIDVVCTILIEIVAVSTKQSYISFLSFVLQLAILVFLFKDMIKISVSKYWSKVGLGVLVSFVGSALYAVYHTLFFTSLFPNYYKEQAQIIRDSGLSGDLLQATLDGLNPTSAAQSSVMVTTIVGLIFSLIISAIIKPKEDEEL